MTLRAHGKSWNEFARWCQARRLKPLPAHPWTLATFVRWCEPRYDYGEIVAITKAIARRHLITGHSDPERHPMVRRTLAMIERRISNKHQRSALFDDDAFSKMEDEPESVEDEQSLSEKPKRRGPAKRVMKSMRSTPKLVRRRR
ncbi:MAG: hypothetical protein H8E36_03155 [Rhodospirillaceae bacterium]|nr:hypothetical protein [Rhodospirillaceae bacterium]MBL6942484.1 hypothetical protein [Rhodospirillales bacterium]